MEERTFIWIVYGAWFFGSFVIKVGGDYIKAITTQKNLERTMKIQQEIYEKNKPYTGIP